MKITDSFRFLDFKKKFTACSLQYATLSVRKRKIDGLLCYNSETLSLLSLCAVCCKLPSRCLPLKLLKNVHFGNNMFSPHCVALLCSCLTSWVRQQAFHCTCASSPSSSSVYRWITNNRGCGYYQALQPVCRCMNICKDSSSGHSDISFSCALRNCRV